MFGYFDIVLCFVLLLVKVVCDEVLFGLCGE